MDVLPTEKSPRPRLKPVMWLLLLALVVALALVAWLRPGQTIQGRDDSSKAPHSTTEQQPAYAHPTQH